MLTAVQEKSDHGMALFSQPMPLMLCKSPHLASFLLLPFLPGPRDEKKIQQKSFDMYAFLVSTTVNKKWTFLQHERVEAIIV
jgi:hypothetical protein